MSRLDRRESVQEMDFHPFPEEIASERNEQLKVVGLVEALRQCCPWSRRVNTPSLLPIFFNSPPIPRFVVGFLRQVRLEVVPFCEISPIVQFFASCAVF